MKKTTYIASPIFYPNAEPHIGHLTTALLCDAMARFYKQTSSVIFSIGVDEHGHKIEVAANNKGVKPQKLCDDLSKKFKNLFDLCNVSYSYYMRTTSDEHKETVIKIWDILLKSEWLYKGLHTGWYSIKDETFYAENEVKDGKSLQTGSEVVFVEEDAWFFKFSKIAPKLVEIYSSNENRALIFPESKRHEIMNWLSSPKDFCVSRPKSRCSWGIPVPDEEDSQTIYVWLDALVNYVTVAGLEDDGWQNAETIHILGKDILRFHAVYWPAILMAAGLKIFNKIVVHGWWLHSGEKMSKSVGNTIDPIELLEKYGVDRLRYFLLRHIRHEADSDFSEDLLVKCSNEILVNNFCNLSSRIGPLIENISKDDWAAVIQSSLWHKFIKIDWAEYKRKMSNGEIGLALLSLEQIGKTINSFISENSLWSNESSGNDQIGKIVAAYEATVTLFVALGNFIPNLSENALKQLGAELGSEKFVNEERPKISRESKLLERV